MTRRLRAAILLGLAALLAIPLQAQRFRRGGDFESRIMPNQPYDGRFTFARIRWEGLGGMTGEGPGWMHDYPWAEQNLMLILRELTTLRPFMDGGNVLRLDDPELMKYPLAYMSEPGFWEPSAEEALGLRNYLLKGGMIVFDDFNGTWMWNNLEQQMRRVVPEGRWMEIPATHPVFDTFYTVEDVHEIGNPGVRYFGMWEDNDPEKRLIAIANYNNDLGEMWQWSGSGFFPIDLTNQAYKLGVNYVIYGMTR
ncbi:MAG TPA: DUF4159 domain-containing protein [Gemmatimonadaceae bacterium]|nr:DUF4159 domain-containing protein [Gemmatimonadaceae bacterium]